MRNVELCVICLEPLLQSKTHTLDCNHIYHRSCIMKLVNKTHARKHPLCPLCRKPFIRKHVRNSALITYLNLETRLQERPRRVIDVSEVNTSTCGILSCFWCCNE